MISLLRVQPLIVWLVQALNVGLILGAALVQSALAETLSGSTELDANKVDLLLQYTGRASGGDGSPAYLRVTRAMAEKAILDGQDAGFAFFRVSVTGYAPIRSGSGQRSDLELWQTDPQEYWTLVDKMFDDLDRADIQLVPTFVWNVFQFPALANETVGAMIRDPRSKSRMLLVQYIEDFIDRYKSRKTVLFYELTNELNLWADLDHRKQCMDGTPAPTLAKCSVMDHFSTDEMVAFSRQLVSRIKRLDPGKSVSSGYSLPRPSAYHLALQPAFSPQGADWTVDTIEQFKDNLSQTQTVFDIISIHLYPNTRGVGYERIAGHEYEILSDVSALARAARKRVFLGEFGDVENTTFMSHISDKTASATVDYAAVWVWEFYQFATNQSFNSDSSRFSLEPGFTDDKISRLTTMRHSAHPRSTENTETVPRVVLTWPLPCSRMDHPVELSAVASAVGLKAVDHVDFLVDGTIVGTAAAPPFGVPFSPVSLGDKRVSVEARAVDRDGRFAIFRSVVLLNQDLQTCTVAGN